MTTLYAVIDWIGEKIELGTQSPTLFLFKNEGELFFVRTEGWFKEERSTSEGNELFEYIKDNVKCEISDSEFLAYLSESDFSKLKETDFYKNSKDKHTGKDYIFQYIYTPVNWCKK